MDLSKSKTLGPHISSLLPESLQQGLNISCCPITAPPTSTVPTPHSFPDRKSDNPIVEKQSGARENSSKYWRLEIPQNKDLNQPLLPPSLHKASCPFFTYLSLKDILE